MGPHSSEQGNQVHRLVLTPGPGASMGPHSSEQGNQWGRVAREGGKRRLQWGLTLPSKETGDRVGGEIDALPLASMGPHSSEQGNSPFVFLIEMNNDASMGPHSSEQGNDTLIHRFDEGGKASMGPHSSEQGNSIWDGFGFGNMLGFNGASLFRARKLVGGRNAVPVKPASMGPHSSEQGNMASSMS